MKHHEQPWIQKVKWTKDPEQSSVTVKCRDCPYHAKGADRGAVAISARKHVLATGHTVALRKCEVRIYVKT